MKTKVLIGVLVVLVGVLAFEGYYIFSHQEETKRSESYINIPKENEEENNSNESSNENEEVVDEEENILNENAGDYVLLVDTREEGNQIVQEYEMVLNGEYQEFEVEFNIVEENDMPGYWTITSLFDDVYLFSVYYDNSDLMVQDYVEYVEKYFNENNFIIFPGTDGINYLLVQDYSFPPAGGVGIYYNIFNQNWDYIGYLTVVAQGQGVNLADDWIWYTNNLGIDIAEDDQIRSKIVDDKIYNLYYECGNDILEERVYTINNSELVYEVINTYPVLSYVGAC